MPDEPVQDYHSGIVGATLGRTRVLEAVLNEVKIEVAEDGEENGSELRLKGD